MHEAIGGDGCGVDGERSHHADQVALEESAWASQLVLLAEALPHALVPEVSELVRLHQRLHVVEGVVEDPVTCSAHSSGDHRHVDGHVALVAADRRQLLREVLDDREVEAQAGAFSDSGWALSSVEALEAVLLEDLGSGVERAGVDLISLSSLDLDSDSRVLDGALNI